MLFNEYITVSKLATSLYINLLFESWGVYTEAIQELEALEPLLLQAIETQDRKMIDDFLRRAMPYITKLTGHIFRAHMMHQSGQIELVDVVNATAMKIWQAIASGKYEKQGTLSAWINTIITHAIMDERRKIVGRKPPTIVDPTDEEEEQKRRPLIKGFGDIRRRRGNSDGEEYDPPDPSLNPASMFDVEALREKLEEELDRLKNSSNVTEQIQGYLLYYYYTMRGSTRGEMTGDEIARFSNEMRQKLGGKIRFNDFVFVVKGKISKMRKSGEVSETATIEVPVNAATEEEAKRKLQDYLQGSKLQDPEVLWDQTRTGSFSAYQIRGWRKRGKAELAEKLRAYA